MESKAIIGNVLTAVITAAVLGVSAWIMGVFEAGTAALDEAQIKAVVKEVLIRENGDTYGSSLVSIDGSLIAIDTNILAIKEDIDDLESAVRALASE